MCPIPLLFVEKAGIRVSFPFKLVELSSVSIWCPGLFFVGGLCYSFKVIHSFLNCAGVLDNVGFILVGPFLCVSKHPFLQDFPIDLNLSFHHVP